MAPIQDGIALLTVLSILSALLYFIGLIQLPSGQRPKTPVYDRFGDALPPAVNPGYQETEDE